MSSRPVPYVAEIHLHCVWRVCICRFVFSGVLLCTGLFWGTSVTFSLHPAQHHQLHVLFPLPLPFTAFSPAELNSFSGTPCTGLWRSPVESDRGPLTVWRSLSIHARAAHAQLLRFARCLVSLGASCSVGRSTQVPGAGEGPKTASKGTRDARSRRKLKSKMGSERHGACQRGNKGGGSSRKKERRTRKGWGVRTATREGIPGQSRRGNKE